MAGDAAENKQTQAQISSLYPNHHAAEVPVLQSVSLAYLEKQRCGKSPAKRHPGDAGRTRRDFRKKRHLPFLQDHPRGFVPLASQARRGEEEPAVAAEPLQQRYQTHRGHAACGAEVVAACSTPGAGLGSRDGAPGPHRGSAAAAPRPFPAGSLRGEASWLLFNPCLISGTHLSEQGLVLI